MLKSVFNVCLLCLTDDGFLLFCSKKVYNLGSSLFFSFPVFSQPKTSFWFLRKPGKIFIYLFISFIYCDKLQVLNFTACLRFNDGGLLLSCSKKV